MEIKRYKNEDGRRVEEHKSVTKLDDGKKQEVFTVLEEVVPMRTKSVVTKVYDEVPVEEKTENFDESGAVETHVKKLTHGETVCAQKHEEEVLEKIVAKLNEIECKLKKCKHGHKAASIGEPCKKKAAAQGGFLQRARNKYMAGHPVDDVEDVVSDEEDDVVDDPTPPPAPKKEPVSEGTDNSQTFVASVLWAVCAVVAALVVYSII